MTNVTYSLAKIKAGMPDITISLPVDVISSLKSHDAAIVLQQLLHWHKTKDGQDFYKTLHPCQHFLYRQWDSLSEETGLTRHRLRKAINTLKILGLVVIKRAAGNTLFFKLNIAEVSSFVARTRKTLEDMGRKIITLVFKPKLAARLGSRDAAILLAQIRYYWKKGGKRKFFKFIEPCQHPFYKPGDSWSEELFMSPYRIRKAMKHLEGVGVLDRWRGPNNLMYFRLNEMFDNLITNMVDEEEADQPEACKQAAVKAKCEGDGALARHEVIGETCTPARKTRSDPTVKGTQVSMGIAKASRAIFHSDTTEKRADQSPPPPEMVKECPTGGGECVKGPEDMAAYEDFGKKTSRPVRFNKGQAYGNMTRKSKAVQELYLRGLKNGGNALPIPGYGKPKEAPPVDKPEEHHNPDKRSDEPQPVGGIMSSVISRFIGEGGNKNEGDEPVDAKHDRLLQPPQPPYPQPQEMKESRPVSGYMKAAIKSAGIPGFRMKGDPREMIRRGVTDDE